MDIMISSPDGVRLASGPLVVFQIRLIRSASPGRPNLNANPETVADMKSFRLLLPMGTWSQVGS
jgi:hypothetical protein